MERLALGDAPTGRAKLAKVTALRTLERLARPANDDSYPVDDDGRFFAGPPEAWDLYRCDLTRPASGGGRTGSGSVGGGHGDPNRYSRRPTASKAHFPGSVVHRQRPVLVTDASALQAERDSCVHNKEIGSAMRLKSLSLATMFVLVALVVGCGDDDNGGAAQTDAPSSTNTQKTTTTTPPSTASHALTIRMSEYAFDPQTPSRRKDR